MEVPECGSFMVFGETEKVIDLLFMSAKKQKWLNLNLNSLFDPAQELNLVVVEFQEGGNGYTYICDDPNIHIGYAVIVPVGKRKLLKKML